MGNIAILGAGNGGLAAAADLTLRGHEVRLSNRNPNRLYPIRERGGVEIRGVLGEGFVPLSLITEDLAKAVNGADIVMLTVPATAHSYYVEALSAHLQPEQLVVLNPGSTGGALHVWSALKKRGFPSPTIAELNTLTYICRTVNPVTVNISARASRLFFATLPATKGTEEAERFRKYYPSIRPVDDVLVTSLANLNAILHPPGMILNAGWIEHTKGDFYYYYEGTTPAVARVIAEVDAERIQIAEAFERWTEPFLRFFYEAGYTSRRAFEANSTFEALKDSVPNRYIRSEPSLEGRYITEDIAYGLVPLRELGKVAGVHTPTMDGLIQLASVATGVDYLSEGLTLSRMGLAGLSAHEVDNVLKGQGLP